MGSQIESETLDAHAVGALVSAKSVFTQTHF